MDELQADKETSALKKLQASAGFVDKNSVERLYWMYEQSYFSKSDNDEKMNKPVVAQSSQDIEDVKALQDSTAGSLFLKSATKTTEDMLRKMREDPLFQIRKQEEAARTNMLANPLVVARLKHKADKQAKKVQKKAKKAEKKQKKAMKKLEKAQNKQKKKKKGSSSSSDSDDSSSSGKANRALKAAALPVVRRPLSPSRSPLRGRAPPARSRSPQQRRGPAAGAPPRRRESPARSPERVRRRDASSPPRQPQAREDKDLGPVGRSGEELGPSAKMVNKREEYTDVVAQRKEASLASRGAPRRMGEDEKKQRLEQMRSDAQKHERSKDLRIASAEQRDKDIEDMEKRMRASSDQSYFRDMTKEAYMGDSSGNVADRLRNQRHRRQRNLNDPLERDS